ncbi:PREDICTED: uncharacterized protein LOC100641243 [Amphimedon queenslandica]|uniref:VWFA domain-containing protein n=2 Tax=Amphimedon queenslandica TaxID=400682 RepID=A0AAN0IWK9_AMPQE|nr:PREDICTED: uncharacterized protein LOC100641243 [Amphimedon queenslandica]|eukprot:XP_019849170.1 PREDICTED: uncharacterized protein LOC100641243 [Amphimedon queenslandica]
MANRGVFNITEQAYCSIQSNKPIAVMQYAKGHLVDDRSNDDRSTKTLQDLADPAMTWVPSAGQYLNRYLISNDIYLISESDPFSSNGVYVTVLPECFNASAILNNVTALESDASKWGRFYCDDLNDICGYGISVDIPQGDHLLRHADPNCAFGAIFFGWGDQKGYAYPAGFGMRPIAETFYTIEPLIPSARESSLGPVSVTVYKSGNVSAASSVEITTIMSSSANAATIGTDLQTQSLTVNFAAGQTSAVATFNFMNDNDPEPFETFLVGFVEGQDINIGTPSQAELGIIDDDSVTIMFDPVPYSVTEGDSNVTLNITFVTSQPLFGASTIRITSIPAAGDTIQATAGVDYVPFNQMITLPAGSTGHYYTTTILSNSEAEPPEHFSATLEFVSGSPLIVTGSNATVTINDVDVPTIRFRPVMYTAIEGRNGQAVSETIRGVTSQPLLGETTIRLTDVPTPGATSPATRDADYIGFTRDIVLPVGATEFSYNVTILSDESVEQSEVFDVDLSHLSGSPLTVVGPDATVTITDSSFITLMFSAPDYSVPENDGRVTLNITASAPVTSNTVISLTYIETNGGALNGSDFGPVPATVTILSGQSLVSFTVDITNDVLPEPTESFDIRMALQSGQSIVVPSGTDTATVTITDSDRSLISYAPRTVSRREENSPAPLTITVAPPYFETFQFESFSVQFSDRNSLAQAGVDYISFNDSLTAVNGLGPISHSVVLLDDEIMEPDEDFGIRLNVLGNVRVDVASTVELAKVIILDTDRISIGFQRPLYVTVEPETSNNPVVIIAETRGTSARPFSVNVEFTDDSAIGGGEDYDERHPSTISASFEAGTNRNATIRANVLSDDIDEFTERFNLSLAFGTNDPFVNRIDFFRKDTIVEILDSDTVTFFVNTSVSTTSVPEDQDAMICVQRNGRTDRNYTVTIQPSLISGGAQSSDFSTAPIMFLFRPTDTQVCRSVPVVDDDIALEGNENFSVSVTGTSPGVDGTPEETTTTTTAVITIIDNDVSMVFFESPRYTGEEGETPKVCLNLTKPIARPAAVSVTSSNGAPGLDPAESTDYSGVPSTVTFTNTSQQQCFDVRYNADTIYEATEGATLTADPGTTGLQPGTPISAVLEIHDSNTPTFIGEGNMTGSGMNVTVRENETAIVCVSLSGSETTSTEVAINLTLTPMQKPGAPDPAEPEDYVSTPKTVTISPGQTRACTQIEVVQDTIDNENDEQFCVNITSDNPVIRYQPPECQIMVTIIDNIRCISYRSDIMIVLDESRSITPESNYILLKNFVLNLTRQFPISETQTHIGLVRFSTESRTRVIIQLTEFFDGDALRNRIDSELNPSDDRRGGETRHNLAMMEAHDEFHARGRSDVRQVIMLLTDGEPDPSSASAREISAEIRADGIDIYGVFIGSDQDGINEIRNISTRGRAFPVNDFNALTDVLDDLIRDECESVAVTFTTSDVVVHESEGQVKVCIEKSAQASQDVNLTLTAKQRNTPPVLPNDARVGSDFPADTQNVIFPRNATKLCYNFIIDDDNIGEPNEVFQVMLMILSPPEVATAPEPTANITIIDDDVNVLEFTSNDYCIEEDKGSVTVCVTKSRVTEYNFTIEIDAFESTPQSARNGLFPLGDFFGGKRQLTFPKDSSQVCASYEIFIEPTGSAPETNETFDVSFTASGLLGGNRTTATGRSMVTIKDSETIIFIQPPMPGTDGLDVPESKGNVTVCVSRNFTTSFDVMLTFIPMMSAAQDNTATPGDDFPLRNKTVNFFGNMTRACATIDITDDDLLEKNETFSVMILVPGHSPETLTANITIIDDDTADLVFGSATYYYTEDDGTGRVCVNTTKPLSVNANIRLITTSTGNPGDPAATATPNSDYTPVNENKTLHMGQTSVCYDIPITKDTQREPQEFFYGRFELEPSSSAELQRCFGSRLTIRSSERARVFINDTSDTICRNIVSDLVILIDESTSINPPDFDLEKQFAADLVEQFPVSQDGTHVSVIRFSNIERTQVISHLGDVTDTATLRQIILAISNNDSFNGRGTFTHHKDAMMLARQQFNDRGREGASKVVVLITDGVPNDETSGILGDKSPQSAIGEATAARNEGVDIFCVGVFLPGGSLVANASRELDALAGDPGRVSLVDNFNALNSTLTEVITGEICEDECRNVVSDLAILIDESTSISPDDFNLEKQFAADLVQQFPVSQDGTHVSVIRFSNIARTQVISHLGDVTDTATLRQIILAISNNDSFNGRGTFTHHKDAMILARQQFNDRGREGASKVVVLITDGVPNDETSGILGDKSPQSAIGEATAARNQGVDIFCVGVFLPGGSLVANASRELNALAGDPGRVSLVDNFNALNSTLTNLISGRICANETGPPQCILREPLEVVPFHPAGNSSASYNFRQMCEHIIAKPCNNDSYVIVGDFLAENLTMGRVGIQTRDGRYVIIDEGLRTRNSTPAPSSVTISSEMSGNEIVKVTLSYNNNEAVIVRDRSMIMISIRSGEICGLCGDLNGNLYSSDGMRLDDVMNQTKVNSFASSWQRAPSQQILRDDRRECAVIKNDTVIGDPLFEAALWVGNTTCQYSLCYEIHGSSDQHYNLLSDLCVSVNAYYTPMRNPDDGNIISAIGIRASDDNEQCHLINIVQDQTTGFCVTTVNSGAPLVVGDTGFQDDSVSVRQRMATRVRIGVPNCERIPLVMWVTCQNMSGELMMRFDISRGVNLRPSSHGLLGQFYNIRMQAQRFTDQSVINMLDQNYFDINNLWVITVTPPTGNTRNFVAELYERAWDNSRSPCLYAGNSQGGHSIEFAANYTDSVIEGHYTHYRVSDRFDTQFRYEKFDSSRCN